MTHWCLEQTRLVNHRLWFILFMCCSLTAASPTDSQPVVSVRTQWSATAAYPGDNLVLAIVLDIQDSFHINPDRAQLHDELLVPTQLSVVNAHPSLTLTAVRYPKPRDVTIGPVNQPRQIEAYEGQTVFYLPIQIANSIPPQPVHLDLELTYQPCDRTVCLTPVSIPITTSLEVVDDSQPIEVIPDKQLFDGFYENRYSDDLDLVTFDVFGWGFSVNSANWTGFVVLLFVAALGGLLLNFTPCVLPIIPLKMMSLNQVSGSRARCLSLGLAMWCGVILFWLSLGSLVAGLSSFTATNQLFQYPLFTILVGVVIALMAIGMCGFFAIVLPSTIYQLNPRQDTLLGSLGLGIMTAILSTPCTAPFMGAAAAWAAVQRAHTTLITFAAIGLGMATPYLILAMFPRLINRFPRTGPGSELIKQVMGIFMLSAAAYFIGVGLAGWLVSPPNPPSVIYWWPVMAFTAIAGGWLVYRIFLVTQSRAKRFIFVPIGMLIVIGSIFGGVRLTDKGPISWTYYTPNQFDAALQDGKVIVLDFTAEWCLNCKWLEKNVLNHPQVVKMLQNDSVVPMKVDLTGRNEVGSRKLNELGRVAIPLLVIYAPDGTLVLESDFYGVKQVVRAISQAGDQRRVH